MPEFLIISPPRTGSTWLATTLNCHPDLFIPDIKELFFFSHFLEEKEWDWYAEHFRPGLGLKKGEASTSYCFLPRETIELIRSAMPRVKLIYLMRAPVARAWSQAKHCFQYRQTNFRDYHGGLEEVSQDKWLECVTDATTRVAGNYLAHLQQWLAVFPKEQLFVDFYESIEGSPRELLSRIFAFLGVRPIRDFAQWPVLRRLNESTPRPIPPDLAKRLGEHYAAATHELAEFLRERFDLSLPQEWSAPVQGPRSDPSASAPTHARAPDLNFTEFEKTRLKLKYTPHLKENNYFGFNIVYFKGIFFGLCRKLGPIELPALNKKDIARLEQQGRLFRSALLERVKMEIAEHKLKRWRRLATFPFRCWSRLWRLRSVFTRRIAR